MTKELPSPEALRKLLRYEPDTGKLFWLPRPHEMFVSEKEAKRWNTRYSGQEAMTANSHGYRSGKVLNFTVDAHRVIWAICHGDWPTGDIDHINGLKDDNRIANLRDVCKSLNQRNAKLRSDNTSGYSGVVWCGPRKKWKVQVSINGKRKHCGYFGDISDAVCAWKKVTAQNQFSGRHGTL